MTLRLVASAANALQGCELEFAHSATRPPLQVAGGGPITPLQRAFERLANLCRHQDALAPIGPGLASVSHTPQGHRSAESGLTRAEAITQTSRLARRLCGSRYHRRGVARAREVAGPEPGILWVRATAIYALAQATTAFALVPLFTFPNSHAVVFGTCLALSMAALLISTSDR